MTNVASPQIIYIMYKVQDYDQAFFTKTLLNQLYVKIDILLTCGYHLDPQHVELPVQCQLYVKVDILLTCASGHHLGPQNG